MTGRLLTRDNLKRCFNMPSAPVASENPLRKILMVGALYDTDEYLDLSIHDKLYLQQTFLAFKSLGLEISPDFTVQVINLWGGEDFLTGDYEADIVISCFIRNPTLRDVENAVFFDISPEHHKENAWSDALKNCGARAVGVSWCGHGELMPDAFKGDDFMHAYSQPRFDVLLDRQYAHAKGVTQTLVQNFAFLGL